MPLKTIFKIFIRLLFGIFILIVLLYALTQTAIFRNKVRKVVERQVTKQMNGELSVGKLEGSFFRSLGFKDVAITQEKDTVIAFGELSAHWSLMTLLKHEISIDQIRLIRPKIFLEQLPDSTWNVNHLFPPSAEEEEEEETETAPFNWTISFPYVEIDNGNVELENVDSIIPKQISEIDLKMNGRYKNDDIVLNLEHFSLKTSEPSLELQKFAFKTQLHKSLLSLDDFIIETAQNKITATSQINIEDLSGMNFSIKTAPLIISEFTAWTGDPGLIAQPAFSLFAETKDDTLQFDLKVETKDEHHSINGHAASWQRIVNGKSDSLAYFIHTQIKDFNLSRWLKDAEMQLSLSSGIEVIGDGYDVHNSNIQTRIQVDKLQFDGRDLGISQLDGILSKGNVNLELNTSGDFGLLTLVGNVDSALAKPSITGEVCIANFNLAPLLKNDSLFSNLNLCITANEFNPGQLTGSIRITADSSSIMDIPVDSILLITEAKSSKVSLDTLIFSIPAASFRAKGDVGMDSTLHFNWQAQIFDPAKLPYVPANDTLSGEVDIHGVVAGTFDSMMTQTNIQIRDVVFNEAKVKSVFGDVDALLQLPEMEGKTNFEIQQVQFGDLGIDSAEIKVDFSGIEAKTDASFFVADTFDTHVSAWVNWEEQLKVGVSNLMVSMNEVNWQGYLDSLRMDSLSYEISNFQFATIEDKPQSISLDGVYSMKGEEDLTLKLDGIRIESMLKMAGIKQPVSGEIYSNFQLTGDADQPIIDGNLSIHQIVFDEYKLGEFSGSIKYDHNLVLLNSTWLPIAKRALNMNAEVPVLFAPATQTMEVLSDSTFVASISTAEFPLSNLVAPVRDLVKLDGILQADLQLNNTLNNPLMKGFIKIPNGTLKVSDYGVDYRDLYLHFLAEGSSLVLDSMGMRRGKGWLGLRGEVQLSDSLLAGEVISNQLSLKAKDFFIVKHKDFEVEISGDVEFRSDTADASFSGGIVVERSKFNVPALIESYGQTSKEIDDAPLLVQALEKDSSIYIAVLRDSVQREESDSKLMKNLKGRFTLDIPRNTWLTSPEGSMEIAGELDIVKESDDFQIFGPLEVVRGHYDMYGRRFKVEEGQIDFVGNYDPNLDFNVEYVFRNPEREKQVMSILITGNVSMPEIEFLLDNESITQGDAISYIVFGKSMNNLSYSEQSSVNENADSGELASGIAASVVSKQLTKLLGNVFSLDMVELKADSDWRSAAFLVGKYITNNLFISYQKNFGNIEDDDVTPEIITLEYELTKFLFLQLVESNSRESGMDLFFKFEKGKGRRGKR